MPGILVYLVLVFLLVLFIAIGILSARSRKKSAIPSGKAIYGDLMAEGRILKSARYRLTGKPDKIVRQGNTVIPYEYKSTDAKQPREGHMLQMAVYFVILEENYPDSRVEYGVLKYRNFGFRIENSRALREELLHVLDTMRSDLGMPDRNHNNAGRCVHCSFRENCPQKLIK